MALAVSAGLTLAPISSALANTVVAQPEDAIASAWVPATLAEQQAARGGYSYSGLSPLFSALTTVCNNFNISAPEYVLTSSLPKNLSKQKASGCAIGYTQNRMTLTIGMGTLPIHMGNLEH